MNVDEDRLGRESALRNPDLVLIVRKVCKIKGSMGVSFEATLRACSHVAQDPDARVTAPEGSFTSRWRTPLACPQSSKATPGSRATRIVARHFAGFPNEYIYRYS